MGTPAHWFKRKVGLALGVMALGSSLGGTLYPIIVKNLIQKIGFVPGILSVCRPVYSLVCPPPRFQWTMRVLGFIEVALLAVQLAVGPANYLDSPLLRADIIV